MLVPYCYDTSTLYLQWATPLLYYVDNLLMTTWLIRWSTIFLGQFCLALDHCNTVIRGREIFPFALESFSLFFERFPTTRPRFPYGLPLKPRTSARMCIWGQLLPKTGQSKWSCSLVEKEVYDLLARVDHPIVLELVLYLYTGVE